MRAARLTAVLAIGLMLIAPTATSAQSSVPTLGLRMTSEVYGDQPAPALQLTSRASAPTTVAMTTPPGWTLEASTLELQPGQEASVRFTSVGPPATMETRQTLAQPLPGLTAGALVVKTKLLSTAPAPPTDWMPVYLTLALALAALFLAIAAIRWVKTNFALTRR